ncbi:MAG TPA: hypothetical protein DDW52_22180 [Planctomycetaceae bacterium]|nr:hypothetical protein [Planctomycetaceae bacterium]
MSEENKPDADATDQTHQTSPSGPVSESPAHGAEAESPAPVPAPGELTEDRVREQLKQVIDPELFVNIVDLGLIYVVDLQPGEEDKTNVLVEMTMTSPMCPAGPQLVANSRQVIEALDGIGEVEIKVVMDPPWTQDMMTEDARDQLGIF